MTKKMMKWRTMGFVMRVNDSDRDGELGTLNRDGSTTAPSSAANVIEQPSLTLTSISHATGELCRY
jgi:hypothetical protein